MYCYVKLIQELRTKKDKLERVIATLEELQEFGEDQAIERRGRKSMGPEERQQVSDRMKNYWACRKKGRAATASPRA
jgi:hypothetical protein